MHVNRARVKPKKPWLIIIKQYKIHLNMDDIVGGQVQ